MKKAFLASLLSLALCCQAEAQGFGGMFPGPGTVHSTGGGGGYSGPGDLQTFVAWGGIYAYSAATRGTAAVNVCNVSDVVCADVNTDATTGLITGTVVIGGSDCAVVICTTKTVYDKTGNGHDWTVATISQRPQFVPSCSGLVNSACLRFGAGQVLVSNTVTQNSPWTVSQVLKRTANFTTQGRLWNDFVNAQSIIGFDSAANAGLWYSGSAGGPQTMTDNAWHVQQGASGASGLTAVDGTVISNPFGSGNINSTITIGDTFAGAGTQFTGDAASWGLVGSGVSNPNLVTLSGASHTILGF